MKDVMVATGAGLAAKLKKTDQVAVAIYGDGTGEQGQHSRVDDLCGYLEFWLFL